MFNFLYVFLACVAVGGLGLFFGYVQGYERASKDNARELIRLYQYFHEILDVMGAMQNNIEKIAEVLKDERKQNK